MHHKLRAGQCEVCSDEVQAKSLGYGEELSRTDAAVMTIVRANLRPWVATSTERLLPEITVLVGRPSGNLARSVSFSA